MALWTEEELNEARRLASACEADDAKWVFADWLLAKEPISDHTVKSGVVARLRELAEELDLHVQHVRVLRGAAAAWPAGYRLPFVSVTGHAIFTNGGAAKASERRAILEAMPRDRWGRVTMGQIRTHLGKSHGRRDDTTVSVSTAVHAELRAEAERTGEKLREVACALILEGLEARRRAESPEAEESQGGWLKRLRAA